MSKKQTDLDKLYSAVSAQFNIGDFDTFKSRMQTAEDRRKFYDAVSENGFDLGDYNQYEARLGKPTEVSAQSSAPTSGQSFELTGVTEALGVEQGQSQQQPSGGLSEQSLVDNSTDVGKQIVGGMQTFGTAVDPNNIRYEEDFRNKQAGFQRLLVDIPSSNDPITGIERTAEFEIPISTRVISPRLAQDGENYFLQYMDAEGNRLNALETVTVQPSELQLKKRQLEQTPFDQWTEDDKLQYFASNIEKNVGLTEDQVVNERIKRNAEINRNTGVIGDAVDIVGGAFRAFGSGATRLGADALGIPEFLYDAISNVAGTPTFKEKYGETFLNDVQDYMRGAISRDDLYNSVRFNNKGVIESFSDGNISDGIAKLVMGTANSLPIMLSLSSGNAGALTSTLSMGAGQYNQLQENNPDMDLGAKMLNSTLTMYAEMIPEKIGAEATFKPFYDLFKKSGREVAESSLNKFLNTLAGQFGVITPTVTEGATEASTAIMQNLIAKYSGEDPNRQIMDGVADAALMGGVSGGIISSPAQVANAISNKKNRKQAETILSENRDIRETLNGQNIPDEVRSALTSKYFENVQKVNDYIESELDAKGRLSNKQQDIVSELERQRNRLNTVVNDPNVPDTLKESIQSDIDNVDTQIEEVLSQADNKGRKLREGVTLIDDAVIEARPELAQYKGQYFKDENGKVNVYETQYENVNTSDVKQPPTDEQKFEDVRNGNIATFIYDSVEDVPDVFKDRITSQGVTNGKQEVVVSMAQSEADYLLQQTNNEAEQPNLESSQVADESSEVAPVGEQTTPTQEVVDINVVRNDNARSSEILDVKENLNRFIDTPITELDSMTIEEGQLAYDEATEAIQQVQDSNISRGYKQELIDNLRQVQQEIVENETKFKTESTTRQFVETRTVEGIRRVEQTAEQQTESKTPKRIADVVDQQVYYNGELGRIRIGEDNAILFESSDGSTIELPIESKNKQIGLERAGITPYIAPKLSDSGEVTTADGRVVGINPVINKDNDGRVVSYTVTTPDGQQRTIRGEEEALDLAIELQRQQLGSIDNIPTERFNETFTEIVERVISTPGRINTSQSNEVSQRAPQVTETTTGQETNNYEQVREQSERIESGDAVFERFSQEEQRGLTSGGRPHVEVSVILSGNERTNEEADTKSTRQETDIEQYAKDNNIWIDNVREEFGEPTTSGQEAIVWDREDGTVIKSQSTNMYGNLQEKLDGITLQNAIFPEAAVEVIGFSRDSDGDFQVVVKQPFVQGTPPTQQEIDTYLSNIGFTKDENGNFSNGDTIIEDVHTGNAIKTPDGNIVVIDPIMRMNTPEMGYGGSRQVSNNISDIQNEQTTQSENTVQENEPTAVRQEPIQESAVTEDVETKRLRDSYNRLTEGMTEEQINSDPDLVRMRERIETSTDSSKQQPTTDTSSKAYKAPKSLMEALSSREARDARLKELRDRIDKYRDAKKGGNLGIANNSESEARYWRDITDYAVIRLVDGAINTAEQLAKELGISNDSNLKKAFRDANETVKGHAEQSSANRTSTERQPNTEQTETKPREVSAKTDESDKPLLKPTPAPVTNVPSAREVESSNFLANAKRNINSDEVKQTLSNIDRESTRGLSKEQKEYFATKLVDALRFGTDVVNDAKVEFGDSYVSDIIDQLQDKDVPVPNKSVITIALELELERQLDITPNDLTLKKQLAYVRDVSVKQQREYATATGYGRLRQIARVGYDMAQITDNFFSYSELRGKDKLESSVESDMDAINKQAEINESSQPTNLEAAIAEGVSAELDKIYDKLPSKRKQAADKAIEALESIQKKLRSKTYDATIGVPVAFVDAGITVTKNAIKAGVAIADAVELGINKINETLKGKKWKEDDFRKDMLSGFTNAGLDTKEGSKVNTRPKTPEELLEAAKERIRQRIDDIKETIADKKHELKLKEKKFEEDAEYKSLVAEERELKKVQKEFLTDESKALLDERKKSATVKRLENDIASIDKQIAKGEKDAVSNGQNSTDNPKITSLRAEKKAKLELLDQIDPNAKVKVKQALIGAGYGREIKVKGETRQALDWKKLAGNEGSVENIQKIVEDQLSKEGYNDGEIARMRGAFIQEYNSLRADIIDKSLKELNRQNKKPEAKTRSSAERLAELYNLGLFDQNPDSYDYLINKAIGLSDIGQQKFFEAKVLAESVAGLYRGAKDEFFIKQAVRNINFQITKLLNDVAWEQANWKFKVSQVVAEFLNLNLRNKLQTLKQAIENPLSGFQEKIIQGVGDWINATVSGNKNDSKDLMKQRKELSKMVAADIVMNGGLYYGEVNTPFLSKSKAEDWLNSLSPNKYYHTLLSGITGKAYLEGADSMYKSDLTEKYFIHNLIKILSDPTHPNPMSKDDAVKFVSEQLTGMKFSEALLEAEKIIKDTNSRAGRKVLPETKENVYRTAMDIVKANLLTGDAMTVEMIQKAYNAAYHTAGLGLGHEANNRISEIVGSAASRIERKTKEAIKEKDWNRAAMLTIAGVVDRNFLNPFVGGGTNWMVLQLQKQGLDVVSPIYYALSKGKKIDLSTKEGMKNLETALKLNGASKTTNARVLIGGATSVTLAMIAVASGAADDIDEWLEENKWAKKYVPLFTPNLLGLVQGYRNGKMADYFNDTFNKGARFDSLPKIAKAVKDFDSNSDVGMQKFYGTLGNELGGNFSVPILPWRLMRDLWGAYKGIKGEPNYRSDFKNIGFWNGYFNYGFIDFLGFRPERNYARNVENYIPDTDKETIDFLRGNNIIIDSNSDKDYLFSDGGVRSMSQSQSKVYDESFGTGMYSLFKDNMDYLSNLSERERKSAVNEMKKYATKTSLNKISAAPKNLSEFTFDKKDRVLDSDQIRMMVKWRKEYYDKYYNKDIKRYERDFKRDGFNESLSKVKALNIFEQDAYKYAKDKIIDLSEKGKTVLKEKE